MRVFKRFIQVRNNISLSKMVKLVGDRKITSPLVMYNGYSEYGCGVGYCPSIGLKHAQRHSQSLLEISHSRLNTKLSDLSHEISPFNYSKYSSVRFIESSVCDVGNRPFSCTNNSIYIS